jgi:hypothetical protein
VQESLLAQTRRDQLIVIPMLNSPRLNRSADSGPAIDEADDFKVTDDPRHFPRQDRWDDPRRRRTVVS